MPPPPLANSFWIEPGRLLAGEYPGERDPLAAKARLDALIDAGITYFIDLTQAGEMPPYDHLLPPARADDGRYVIYVRKAITDHGLPSHPEAMADTLDYLARALEVGHGVYVHCRAGIGRTNTVIGCWLRRSGLTGQAALERLNEAWAASARSRSWPRVPESAAQTRYVLDWREPDAAPALPLDLDTARVLRARYQGCLVGLACGDAVGATLQFRLEGQFTPVTDLLGGGHWQLPRGAWTDDTAMTLCLAESLLEHEDFNAEDQLQRYRRWQQQGYLSSTGQCLGITSAVAARLAQFGAAPGAAAPPAADGAQALVRIAAIALFAGPEPARAFDWAAAAAGVTGATPATMSACRSYAALLIAALRGALPGGLVDDARELLRLAGPAGASAAFDAQLASNGTGGPTGAAGGLLAWIVAELSRAAGFRDGLLAVVNRGGDADVHGAVFGALAGALYGEEGIPRAWRSALLRRELLQTHADRLLAAALAPRL